MLADHSDIKTPDARTIETRLLIGPIEENPVADTKTSALRPMHQVTLAGPGYSRVQILYLNIIR